MNKQYFVIAVTLLIVIFSCRKDDICTQSGTPKIGLSFYDYSMPDDTLKKVDNLTVIALPVQDTLFNDKSLNHIDLPLDTGADSCQFIIEKGTNPDTLTFSYIREDIFISKSCGFKTIFHQLNIDLQQDNDNWIKHIEIINHEITIDTTHVKIYH